MRIKIKWSSGELLAQLDDTPAGGAWVDVMSVGKPAEEGRFFLPAGDTPENLWCSIIDFRMEGRL